MIAYIGLVAESSGKNSIMCFDCTRDCSHQVTERAGSDAEGGDRTATGPRTKRRQPEGCESSDSDEWPPRKVPQTVPFAQHVRFASC